MLLSVSCAITQLQPNIWKHNNFTAVSGVPNFAVFRALSFKGDVNFVTICRLHMENCIGTLIHNFTSTPIRNYPKPGKKFVRQRRNR